MKKIIMTLAILTFASLAKAGNEGPQADPSAPATVLAEYVISGGLFVPPNVPVSRHYQVLSNHKAIEVKYFRSASPEVQVIKTLTDAEWTQINELINSIEPGALYDANPDLPACQDGPTFSWIVNGSFGTITIAQKRDCKQMQRENSSSADGLVVNFLNSLAKLAD
ncbi:MAG TPA: hypothetical protein VN132_09065 [Bdellovibrio sp.]|nr:hypothetical protein [Bdellovibrio sp.]